jgi:hypothetical protein
MRPHAPRRRGWRLDRCQTGLQAAGLDDSHRRHRSAAPNLMEDQP